jgi:hypothetical protein
VHLRRKGTFAICYSLGNFGKYHALWIKAGKDGWYHSMTFYMKSENLKLLRGIVEGR